MSHIGPRRCMEHVGNQYLSLVSIEVFIVFLFVSRCFGAQPVWPGLGISKFRKSD